MLVNLFRMETPEDLFSGESIPDPRKPRAFLRDSSLRDERVRCFAGPEAGPQADGAGAEAKGFKAVCA